MAFHVMKRCTRLRCYRSELQKRSAVHRDWLLHFARCLGQLVIMPLRWLLAIHMFLAPHHASATQPGRLWSNNPRQAGVRQEGESRAKTGHLTASALPAPIPVLPLSPTIHTQGAYTTHRTEGGRFRFPPNPAAVTVSCDSAPHSRRALRQERVAERPAVLDIPLPLPRPRPPREQHIGHHRQERDPRHGDEDGRPEREARPALGPQGRDAQDRTLRHLHAK
jgi:hypothetical protein